MTTINLFEQIGQNVFREDAKAIYEQIELGLNAGEIVVLDFANVRIVMNDFIDLTIGYAVVNYPLATLREQLKIENVSDVTRFEIRLSIEYYKQIT